MDIVLEAPTGNITQSVFQYQSAPWSTLSETSSFVHLILKVLRQESSKLQPALNSQTNVLATWEVRLKRTFPFKRPCTHLGSRSATCLNTITAFSHALERRCPHKGGFPVWWSMSMLRKVGSATFTSQHSPPPWAPITEVSETKQPKQDEQQQHIHCMLHGLFALQAPDHVPLGVSQGRQTWGSPPPSNTLSRSDLGGSKPEGLPEKHPFQHPTQECLRQATFTHIPQFGAGRSLCRVSKSVCQA